MSPLHLGGEPVTGMAGDLEPTIRHTFGGVATDAAGDNDPSGRHPGGHMMNAAEVTMAFDRAVGRVTADGKDVAQRAGPLVCSYHKPANGIIGQAGELIGHNAAEVDRERAARCRIGHDGQDERHQGRFRVKNMRAGSIP
jgi:hypothetical protein